MDRATFEQNRSVRTAGRKVTYTNDIEISAYFPNYESDHPGWGTWSAEKKRMCRYRHVFTWEGPDDQLIEGMLKAKKVVDRIEKGELCPCNRSLTMPNKRLCNTCAFKAFFGKK